MLVFELHIQTKPREGVMGKMGFRFPRWIDSVRDVPKSSPLLYELTDYVPLVKFDFEKGYIPLYSIKRQLRKNRGEEVMIRYFGTENPKVGPAEMLEIHLVKLEDVINVNSVQYPGGIQLVFNPDPTEEVVKKYFEKQEAS